MNPVIDQNTVAAGELMVEQEKQTNRPNVNGKVRRVNEVLKKGEPRNISVDNFSNMTGYVPQFIIDAMNAVFGIGGWGFEEISSTLVDRNPKTDKPSLAIAQVRVWLEGVAAKPVAYGQSRVTRGDFGDARKGAQTDAIKKALSYFSVGNRAYYGKLKAGLSAQAV